MTHYLILNRAECKRCGEELVSQPPYEAQVCDCGYLSIDGGTSERIRRCLDLPGDETYRDYVDTSILSSTWMRRGLRVEAFVTEFGATVLSPAGQHQIAEPGDWIVFEPEGGHTAWVANDFYTVHRLQNAEAS